LVAVEDDYLTVTMLAAGLAGIMSRRRRAGSAGRGEDGLLPAAWRSAVSRLWWRCQAEGARPFESDLEVLGWCARPFAAWPIPLSLSEHDLQSCLVVDGELSTFAEQGARLAHVDVEAEWTENRVYEALRTAASANGGEDDREVERAYGVLRRLLIDHPVIGDRDLMRWERRFGRTDSSGQTYVRRLIDTAYVSRPAQGVQQYLRCPCCRNPVPTPTARCGTAGCAAPSAESATSDTLAVIYEQHRATRRFVHDPGLVEARIFDALDTDDLREHVRLTAYPGLDTLDLLIEFLHVDPGGTAVVAQTWGVDAKDQVSARLLGRGFSWPEHIAADRRFLVLPTHRASEPGYVEDLSAELDGRVQGVEVVAENQLTALVRATARRLAR
jgi:hypothetical protein